MKKKILPFILTLVLVLGSSVAEPAFAEEEESPAESASSSAVFRDIKDHWAENTITEAVSLGIVGGYPDGTFLPDNLIKREEFFTLICGILTEKPDTAGTVISFTDIESDGWYLSTIQLAVAGNMTSGYPDGTFGIGIMMTRQDAAHVAASVISGLDSSQEAATDISTLSDVKDISEYAYDTVNLMFQKGYMRGDTEGRFRPTTAITRAEAVQLLLQVKKNEPVIKAGLSGRQLTEAERSGAGSGDETAAQGAIVVSGCILHHLPDLAGKSEVTAEDLVGLPAGAFLKGDGTAASPYEVSTQEQLDHIREHAGAGVYFKITRDLNVSGDFATVRPGSQEQQADWTAGNWTPLGTKSEPFNAILDGNGYTISGLEISSAGTGNLTSLNLSSDASGLIGYLGEKGQVKDLTIAQSNIENTGAYAGAIAGYSEGSIEGCKTENSVTIKGGTYTGGIAGFGQGSLSDCINRATVTASGRYTGGIVGAYMVMEDNIESCVNYGSVTGVDSVGGIAGTLTPVLNHTFIAVNRSTNHGLLQGGSNYTGGIAGMADGSSYSVDIENCINNGSITSSGISGGISGYNKGTRVIIKASGNTGAVHGASAGGIAGINDGSIELCYNDGVVTGSIFVGGIAATQQESRAKITKCYNTGRIGDGSASNIGGIAGENTAMILSCFNDARINGTSQVGGIAGKNSGRIANTYNTGDISGSNETGSLAGRNYGTLTDSFWLSDTAAAAAGGTQSSSVQTSVLFLSKDQFTGDARITEPGGSKSLIEKLNGYYTSNEADVWVTSDRSDFPWLAEI